MNSSKISPILIACAVLAAGGMAHAQESTGQGIKQDAKAAGHAVGDAGVKVGHGAKDVGLKIGHGARDGWNATKHAVKHAVGKED